MKQYFEGPYCIGCEEFKLPGDLDEGKCKIHSKPVEMLSEDNWFFKLSAFKQPLLDYYKSNPDACQPESARNEVISFLEGEVRDLSISRSTFDWGIPVPWDTKQVIYVWFDANSSIIFKSFSKSSTTGASFGCNATAATTWPMKLSAHLTDQIDCSAE